MTSDAGSLQPMEANEGKWYKNIDAAALNRLSEIGKTIDETVNDTVISVARGKLKVGKLLREARALIPGDKQFGQWRKQFTLVKSKQAAHNLMQIAEKFGSAPELVASVSMSVLQELVTADQSTVQWVKEQVAEDKPPTVKAVREQKAPKPKKTLEEYNDTKKVLTGAVLPKSKSVVTPDLLNERAQLVARRVSDRVDALVTRHRYDKSKGMDRIQQSYLMFGLCPEPSVPINMQTVEILLDALTNDLDDAGAKTLSQAYDVIIEDIKHFEEV